MDLQKTLEKPEKPLSQHRVLVASLPKAGTYLLAEILKELGCRATDMHLFGWGYTDYSQATLEEGRQHPERLRREQPLAGSLSLIDPGSFAVSHLACREENVRLLHGFRRIFLFRELRACLVSWMRFLLKTKRNGVEETDWFTEPDPRRQLIGFLEDKGPFMMRQYYLPMVGWLKYPGTLSVRYEDLARGDEQAARVVELIGWYLDAPEMDGAEIIRSSLSTETLTKSPRRTVVQEYWSDEADAWFAQYRGVEANRVLGYGESASVLPADTARVSGSAA